MNYCAFELLSLVYECERTDRPEMIPSPCEVRTDPEFSDALDFLLDNDFVKVAWTDYGSPRENGEGRERAFSSAAVEALKITLAGTRALEEEKQLRPALRAF